MYDTYVIITDAELCGDSTNKFYKFSQVRHQLLAVQSVSIAEQIRHVKKL
jgi:hypothetical protein